MASPERFAIIRISCLECTGGDPEPEVIVSVASIERARRWIEDAPPASDTARFIFDTVEGKVAK